MELYLFRDNRWYRDDYLEVPFTVLRKLTALSPSVQDIPRLRDVKQSTLSQWPRINEIMDTLTPWQIANGLIWTVREEELGKPFDPKKPRYLWRPLAELGSAVLEQYDVLRFYASLPPDQQTQLRDGTLMLSSLSSAQQQQALVLLSSPPHAGEALQLRAAFPDVFVTSGTNPGAQVELPVQFQITLVPPPASTR